MKLNSLFIKCLLIFGLNINLFAATWLLDADSISVNSANYVTFRVHNISENGAGTFDIRATITKPNGSKFYLTQGNRSISDLGYYSFGYDLDNFDINGRFYFKLETFDINGQENNWNTANRFDTLETNQNIYEKNDPTPNPMTFSTNPQATGNTTIFMAATTASDVSGGIEYYFDAVSGSPNRTDSGWQTSTSYNDGSLASNTKYGYKIKAKDANGNETSLSSTKYIYTKQVTPTIEVSSRTTTSISLRATNINNSTSGDSAIRWDGDSSSAGETDSGWEDGTTYTDSGLEPGQQYRWRAYARNGDGIINSTWSSWVYGFTFAKTPNTPTVIATGKNSVTVNVNPNGNPSDIPFAIYCKTNGKYITSSGGFNSTKVWQTDSAWGTKIINGLLAGTTYEFQVKAKNEDNEETILSDVGSVTTDENLGSLTVNVNNVVNGSQDLVGDWSVNFYQDGSLTCARTNASPTVICSELDAGSHLFYVYFRNQGETLWEYWGTSGDGLLEGEDSTIEFIRHMPWVKNIEAPSEEQVAGDSPTVDVIVQNDYPNELDIVIKLQVADGSIISENVTVPFGETIVPVQLELQNTAGTYDLKYWVEYNKLSTPENGLKTTDHGLYENKIIISSQENCTYSINSTSVLFEPNGGNGIITLNSYPTNCIGNWNVSDSSDWIELTSDISGDGSGIWNITYSINANQESGRSEVITIAGLNYEISQNAGFLSLYDFTYDGINHQLTDNNFFSNIPNWDYFSSERKNYGDFNEIIITTEYHNSGIVHITSLSPQMYVEVIDLDTMQIIYRSVSGKNPLFYVEAGRYAVFIKDSYKIQDGYKMATSFMFYPKLSGFDDASKLTSTLTDEQQVLDEWRKNLLYYILRPALSKSINNIQYTNDEIKYNRGNIALWWGSIDTAWSVFNLAAGPTKIPKDLIGTNYAKVVNLMNKKPISISLNAGNQYLKNSYTYVDYSNFNAQSAASIAIDHVLAYPSCLAGGLANSLCLQTISGDIVSIATDIMGLYSLSNAGKEWNEFIAAYKMMEMVYFNRLGSEYDTCIDLGLSESICTSSEINRREEMLSLIHNNMNQEFFESFTTALFTLDFNFIGDDAGFDDVDSRIQYEKLLSKVNQLMSLDDKENSVMYGYIGLEDIDMDGIENHVDEHPNIREYNKLINPSIIQYLLN